MGSAITKIDAEELQKKKQPSVLEVLRTVPGVAVVQSGGRGRQTSVFIRGGKSDHTLVLIDGVRVNSVNTGQYDFADLKTENIERIEILRGPQSVLYGSEAIGGVISIFTKQGEGEAKSTLSAEGGSNATQQYTGTISYGGEQFRSSSSVSFFDTDGFSTASRGTEEDGYSNVNVATQNGVNFLDDGRADFVFRYTRGDVDLDGFEFGIGPVDDLNAEQTRDTYIGSVKVSKPFSDKVTPSIQFGYVDESLEGEDPDTEFNNFDIKSELFSITPTLEIAPIESNTITLGYEFETRSGSTSESLDETRDFNSFFLQDQHSFDDWLFLTGGVRYDDDSEFGGETTYRVSFAALSEDTGSRLHASYGTGFKAPTLNELFFPGFGNPELEPETSWGYDVGVEQELGSDAAVLDVTFFQNEFDDLITFDPNTFLAANINSAEAWGIETVLDLRLCSFADLVSQYTYTDSEDNSTGELLPRRPRHRWSFDLFLSPIEKFDAALTFLMVQDRIDSDGGDMDDYERVDLTLSYDVTEKIKPFVRFENLFDQDYQELPGFSSPGFVVFGGVELFGF